MAGRPRFVNIIDRIKCITLMGECQKINSLTGNWNAPIMKIIQLGGINKRENDTLQTKGGQNH